MPDFKNGFSIDIKYGERTEKQNFSMAKDDDALCLYEQGSYNAVMMLEPKKREFTIDNSTHRFDAISKENIIILKDVSNIQIQYNTDFTITTDTEKGKRTFKISHHELSVKIGTSFTPVATFNKPLDVTLPESLPTQISNGNIKMNSFPAQMTNMLVNDYKYQALTLRNGTTILKSPEGKILFQDGTKWSTSSLTDIVQAPSGLVLRFLPMSELSKIEENRLRKGTRISEEDAKAFSEFVGSTLDLNQIPHLTSDSSYIRLTKFTSTYRLGKDTVKNKAKKQEDNKDAINNTIDGNLNNEYFTINTPIFDNLEYPINLGINANDYQSVGITGNPTELETNDTSSKSNSISHNDDSNNGDAGDTTPQVIPNEQIKPQKQSEKPNEANNFATDTPKKQMSNPVPPQSDNNKGKNEKNIANEGNNADNNSKKDKELKKTVNEKEATMVQKGIRIILLIVAANFFMAALMLANPLFALLATMCVAGMATSLAVQSMLPSGTFSSMFSIGKDFKEWLHAKHSIKELSLREERTLEKLSKKAQKKSLSKRNQEKLQRLETRSREHLSHNEYREKLKAEKIQQNPQDLPSFHKLNELRAVAQQQQDKFNISKEEALNKLDKEIVAREKLLNIGEYAIPEDKKALIIQDINTLKNYKNRLYNFENPVSYTNNSKLDNLENNLKEDMKQRQEAGQEPYPWLDHEPEIDKSDFSVIIKNNGLEQPAVNLDIEQLKAIETEYLKHNYKKQETKKTKDSTTKTDDGPTFTPTII